MVGRQQPPLFSRLYQYKIVSVYVTSPAGVQCVFRARSTSQETLQFTYHIQTAFVLNICHFHSLISQLSVSLFRPLPESPALNQDSFFLPFINLFANVKWKLSLSEKPQHLLLVQRPKTNFIFSWWVTSCGHKGNYYEKMWRPCSDFFLQLFKYTFSKTSVLFTCS